MTKLGKALGFADKIGITVFFLSLSYRGYLAEEKLIAIVVLVVSLLFGVYLFMREKDRPVSNKYVDVFVVVMCILGFKFDDRSMLIPGIAACIAALVDFAYCIYLKYIEERVDSSLQR